MIEKIKERFQNATKAQWIKGLIACVLYILFIIWHGNYWWFLLLPVIFDAFVTKFIPWGFWKNIKNKTLRSIMGWVDAIVFALIGVYFIFNYFFQNYQIPTSSLEKTLLVGDFLFVSKATYGPRVPMTPLHFPLAQHTMPLVGGKSYFDKPQWEYRRLKGLRDIQLDDIVVFNFPTGDTVPLKVSNPDYYTLVHYLGRDAVWNNPQRFGEIIYRPVDRRENYVKRCVTLPGSTFEMRDNQIYVDGKAQPHFPGIQHNYYVQTDGTLLSNEILTKLGISNEDRVTINPRQHPDLVLILQYDPGKPIYQFPLTEENLQKIKQIQGVTQVKIEPTPVGEIFPLGANTGWDRDNYGPLYIPKKGDVLDLTLENLPIYERIIRNYEHNKLEVRNDIIYINDVASTTYTTKMDYYWMLGDNRHKSADSRYWGFVPEDHIVGRPVFVWLSLDKDKSGFGKVRWNRFFHDARR
ncbi:signal peptidase I [Paludibacteraceae bacterium OttesenSCG-928-F17]|nr:signal peptidase I [Paludibacteraceae bacterium OttesenSCG-928-F17]